MPPSTAISQRANISSQPPNTDTVVIKLSRHGAPPPTLLLAIGTNGGAPTWASVTGLVKEVEIDNAIVAGSLAFVTNPKVKNKLSTTPKVASTVSVMILDASKDKKV